MPNPNLTPGKLTGHTLSQICKVGYTLDQRHVTKSIRKEVMRRYGLDPKNLHDYEIDHYVSLELGGSNDIENLWPQPILEARKKDVVETKLHRRMCRGEITLEQAQQSVENWEEIYKEIKAKK